MRCSRARSAKRRQFRRSRPSRGQAFEGEAQAKSTALACSAPPEGRARWERRLAGRDQTSIAAIRLLAEHVVERKIVVAVHFNTVGRALKKTISKPHLTDWVIPPKANAAFVAAMEDVLDVYTRPRDLARPLVCLDETSKQLVAETRMPEPRANRKSW